MTTVRGTTSTDIDLVGIITGKALIDSADLSPDQWTRIIEHAVGLMSLKQLRGCKTLTHLLESTETWVRGGAEPAAVVRSDAELVNVHASRAYLECCSLTKNPLFRRGAKDWPTTKRANSKYGYEESVYVPVLEELLLLGRDGRFVIARATWELAFWWDECGYGDEPLGIWLEATKVECTDTSILELITENPARAPNILYQLRLAQMRTAQEVADQARPVERASDKLKGILDILGMIT